MACASKISPNLGVAGIAAYDAMLSRFGTANDLPLQGLKMLAESLRRDLQKS
jgi:hypothetical protein